MSKIESQIDKENLTVRMERVIAAPLERVWAAHASAEQVAQWWGPRKYSTVIDKMDFREGGEWRFVHSDDEGQSFAFRGVYQEIVDQDHITWTFEFEPMAGHILTETIYFETAGDGQTRMKTVSQYESLEDLEGMTASGMEDGANETWDRLEEFASHS